jgi:hypothetical protein
VLVLILIVKYNQTTKCNVDSCRPAAYDFGVKEGRVSDVMGFKLTGNADNWKLNTTNKYQVSK